jgi:hypothetical protein
MTNAKINTKIGDVSRSLPYGDAATYVADFLVYGRKDTK